jgi:hypothetical protein
MTYTIDQLEQDIQSIIQELKEMRASKGHDYSSSEDTLENLRLFGCKGVVVRIGDKLMRLKSYMEKGLLLNESAEDTMKDLINYALYLLIMHRGSK